MAINIPSPSNGGVNVGRVKIADNASPIPQDRIFCNFNYFDNVPLVGGSDKQFDGELRAFFTRRLDRVQ